MKRKFLIVAFFVFFLFSILLVQFFHIQVTEHDKWAKLAHMQHNVILKEPFQRGVFYSNTAVKKGDIETKQPLVLDVLAYHLYVDPMLIPEERKKEIAEEIEKRLSLEKSIERHFTKKSRFRRVAMWLDPQERESLETWWLSYARMHKIAKNALYFMKDYKRSYPFGKLLGQVLQTVREERDSKTHQAIPTGGLEMVFNEELKGVEGKKVLLRAPRYEMDKGDVEIEPKDGNDIYLTINHVLQAIAEDELAKGVEKVGAKNGWAVMMDPYTGEILALAHYPFFDPSKYREYYNNPEKIECTRCKVVTDCFEPGSTMKILSMTIALKANAVLMARGEAPLFDPKEKMRTDQTSFPGRSQPLTDVRTRKYLNMNMAIQKSSNVYPARIIQRVIERLGSQWYRKQLVELFGFGEKTGIELPYENPGLVPTPGKLYSSGASQWSQITPYSLAIGYNILVNTIQLVRAVSVLANGGYLVEPTLIRKIVSHEGVVLDKTKERKRKKVLDEEIARRVVAALKFATKPGGSAALADIPGYTEAGKTATTEKLINGKYSKTTHFSSFIGFAPAKEPRFVLFIGIDEPEKIFIRGFGTTHFGGKCAAPIFRDIALRSLQYLGVPQDDPYAYPKGDPRTQAEKADYFREVKELNALCEEWNGE